MSQKIPSKLLHWPIVQCTLHCQHLILVDKQGRNGVLPAGWPLWPGSPQQSLLLLPSSHRPSGKPASGIIHTASKLKIIYYQFAENIWFSIFACWLTESHIFSANVWFAENHKGLIKLIIYYVAYWTYVCRKSSVLYFLFNDTYQINNWNILVIAIL